MELIETVYRLELDGEPLLGAMLDSLGRHFEPRRPLVSIASELQPDGTIRYHAVVTRRDPSGTVMQVMEEARQRATDWDHDRMFYGEPACHSLTTLVSDKVHEMAAAGGVAELVGLNCGAGDAHGIMICAVRGERYRPPPGERRFWQPVAQHVAAALRMRRSIAAALPEAVIREDGRIVDATGDARGPALRERLRHAMLMRDRRRTRRSRDGEPFWPELVAGRWTLVDRFEADGRRHVIAVRNDRRSPRLRTLSKREQAVLVRVAHGEANKAIALDLGVSEATVSRTASAAMVKLGMNLASIAELTAARFASSRVGMGEVAFATLPAETAATVARLAMLGKTERDVVMLAIRGKSNIEIAAARGRSIRTVVNQLSAAYSKLGVQSRRELVLRCAPAAAQSA